MQAEAKTIRVTREGNGTYELTLRPEWTDGEPRVRDLDLATWLEFSQPRDIRKIISRHAASGRLKPVCATVAQTSKGGRPGTEFYLSEREALFIASQSKTSKALDVTQRVIDVFVLVRRQALLPPPAPPAPKPERTPRPLPPPKAPFAIPGALTIAAQIGPHAAERLSLAAARHNCTREEMAARILAAWAHLTSIPFSL